MEVPDPEDAAKGSGAGKKKFQIFLTSPGGAMDVFLVDSNSDGNDEIKRKLRTVASRNEGNKSSDAGNPGDDMNTWKSSQEHLNSQDELDPTNLMQGDDGISRNENS